MATPPFEPVMPPPSDAAGYCQNCGRPLSPLEMRRVGSAIFCEPCLIARVAAPGTPTSGPAGGPAGGPSAGPIGGWPWENPAGTTARASINPGLAALLGFIPGVGAMYNEQYAKGVAHLVIFAVLVSLSHVTDFFGIVLGGWVIYMVIEAHHTARARRDGTPLPNPFGLNDIGERMGFGRSWPQGPPVAGVARDMADAFTSVAHDTFRPAVAPVPPAQWGAPSDQYAAPADIPSASAAYGQPVYTQVPYAQPPFTPFEPAAIPPQPSRFPSGAAWLIGLGILFLLSSTRIFSGIPNQSLPGFVLAGFGIWLFVRNYVRYRNPALNGLPNLDERTTQILQVSHGLRSSLMLLLVGALILLAAFRIVSWRHSWPLVIIGVGVLMLLTRTINSIELAAMPAQPAAWPPGTPYPANPYPPQPYPGATYPAPTAMEPIAPVAGPADEEVR